MLSDPLSCYYNIKTSIKVYSLAEVFLQIFFTSEEERGKRVFQVDILTHPGTNQGSLACGATTIQYTTQLNLYIIFII